MDPPRAAAPFDRRTAAVVAAAALPGALLLGPEAPRLLSMPLPLPPAAAQLITTGALVVAALAAAVAGAALGPALGLRALPARPRAWRPVVEAVALGAIVAALIPAAPDLRDHLSRLPPEVRLLYGGFTEEVLVRWGLTTVALVATRRALPAAPRAAAAAAVALACAAYAAGHVLVLAQLPPGRLAATLAAVALLSLPWGYLYCRWSLATAVLSHVVFHVVLSI